MELTNDLIRNNGMTTDFPSDQLPLLEPQFPFNLIHSSFPANRPLTMPVFQSSTSHPEADNRNQKDKQFMGGRKRKRNHERNVEKPSDVIHVRAKRGQATDSHSLAERVRRKKINERLSSLQELVPGCHKTMGMAVMLEVVIKYINSLQHQIEFLSMKLLAASLFHDFNSSDMDALDTMQMQQGANGNGSGGVAEMERVVTEGYGGLPYFHSTSPI